MTPDDDSQADARGRLVPVIARVIELGRGPPALVRWVRERLDQEYRPGPAANQQLAGRLAAELARWLRTRNGRASTLIGRPRPTVLMSHGRHRRSRAG